MSIFGKLLNKDKYKDEPWLKHYSEEERNLKITDKTIYEYLKSRVERYNYNLVALNYFGKKITYRELFNKIEQASKSLLTYGVKEGDVVTICMPNTPEAIICFYACNNIGAVANMVHPLSAPEEIKQYLLETNSKFMLMIDLAYEKVNSIIDSTLLQKVIVVSAKDSMPTLLKIGYQITKGFRIKKPSFRNFNYVRWSEFLLKGILYRKDIEHNMSDKDIALILHSGGTTGVPKGILLSNSNFNALAQQAEIIISRVRAKDKVLTILPVFHGFGLGVCVHCPLCISMEVILMPQFDNKRFSKIVKEDKPQVLAGIPTLWESMINNKDLVGTDMSQLKYVISGGDYLTEGLEQKINSFLRKNGAAISVTKGYGMTESVAATAFTVDGTNEPCSVGIPLPTNKCCICVPKTQDRLPFGEEGEICISGPTVMVGYLDNEKETNMVLQKHEDGNIWLHTGDMGYLSPEGILYFTQRLKRMIISSGFNVYPSQIEEVIERHPDVLKCSVIGVPHPHKMQVAKAYIVLKPNKKESSKIKKEIKELCEQNLAKYSWPKEYEFRESLPKTLLGKVNYRELENENK